jgi:outer membrane protein assembly factor BamD (BamD/ComL family)
LNPALKESANTQVVYTAGIRGAESTDTLLKPYWKDDLTRDKNFQLELQKYSLAQLKMDRGELESAVESFDSFLNEFTHSDLRPNALFGKSISLAGLGRTQQSLATMQQFVDENPNHPLHDDAERVIEELN